MTDLNDESRSEEIAAYFNRRRAEDAARGHMDVIVDEWPEPEPPRRWTLNRVLAVAALVALAVILAALAWGWTV